MLYICKVVAYGTIPYLAAMFLLGSMGCTGQTVAVVDAGTATV